MPDVEMSVKGSVIIPTIYSVGSTVDDFSGSGVIGTISLGSGGTGYVAAEVITVVQAGGALGTVTIDTVDANGVITAVTLLAKGSGYTVANGLAVTGGSGTGATINILTLQSPKILSVVATGNFTAGNRVVVNRSGAREEQAVIDSVQAGVSITLLTDLVYTHTIVQADIVEVCMASLSSVLDKSHHKYMCIFLPSNWTTAAITFVGCDTPNGTFNQVVDSVAAAEVVTASMVASLVVSFSGANRDAIAAVPFIQLRSGTLAAPVDQGAGDIIIKYVKTR